MFNENLTDQQRMEALSNEKLQEIIDYRNEGIQKIENIEARGDSSYSNFKQTLINERDLALSILSNR